VTLANEGRVIAQRVLVGFRRREPDYDWRLAFRHDGVCAILEPSTEADYNKHTILIYAFADVLSSTARHVPGLSCDYTWQQQRLLQVSRLGQRLDRRS
jgi:hypothetical protein